MSKYQLECARIIDSKGNPIPPKSFEFKRYGDMEYDSWDEAMQARYDFQMNTNEYYIRVGKIR